MAKKKAAPADQTAVICQKCGKPAAHVLREWTTKFDQPSGDFVGIRFRAMHCPACLTNWASREYIPTKRKTTPAAVASDAEPITIANDATSAQKAALPDRVTAEDDLSRCANAGRS